MNDPPLLGDQRDPPPYFAGRQAEFAALYKRLDYLCAAGDAAGGMSLIIGVPGVGKTQLAREFTKRAEHRECGRSVYRLHVDTESLTDGTGLFLDIVGAVDDDKRGREIADLGAKVTGRSASAAGVVKAGYTVDHARRTGSLSAMLRRSMREGLWERKALVLVVDELQTVAPSAMTALRVLHEGQHQCPILLVGVGLQHTPAVLANPGGGQAGISRVAQTLSLSSLNEADTVEAVARNLLVLGHKGVPEASVSRLATASHGFPQHIHGYLQGAVNAIAQHGHLNGGDALRDALAFGDRERAAYYDGRLAPARSLKPMLVLVAELDRRRATSMDIDEAIAVLDEAGFDGEDATDHAVRHGALTLDGRDEVSFGIPSFHNHLRQEHVRQRRRREREVSGERPAG